MDRYLGRRRVGPRTQKVSAMAHSHYVMDSYFPDGGGSDRFRREALRLVASDDAEAMAEGRRIDQWKKSSFYQIRSIVTSARSGDKVIYSSRAAEAAPSEPHSLEELPGRPT